MCIPLFRIGFFLVLGSIFGANPLPAQYVSSEQSFPVEGYSVFEKGYPLFVAPGGEGKFVYLEYWAEGKQGHRTSNVYLQNYGTQDYVEYWFQPITEEGTEPMLVTGLRRLTHCYAVIGKQYRIEGGKDLQTVARFFDLDGKSRDRDPSRLSTFTKSTKTQREWLETSPNGEVLLWVGSDGRECEMTLWGSYGGNRWEEVVEIPFAKEKYELIDVKVNDAGEPLLLLQSPKTPEAPLVLCKFLQEEARFLTTLVNRDPAMKVGTVKLAITEQDELLLLGCYGAEGVMGLMNGQKLSAGDPMNWTHLFFQRLSASKEEWTVLTDSVYSIPKQWIDFFAGEGSNFADTRIFVKNGEVTMVLEEQYADRQKVYYYNLGIVGFQVESGSMQWSDLVEKRQRDQGAAHFLSYVPGIVQNKLRLVYLSERGARGKLMCTSFDMGTGKRKDKMLASNETSEYLVFPRSSGMVSSHEMVLVSMGNPSQNNYKLITITF